MWRFVLWFTLEDSGSPSFQPADNNTSEPADQKMGGDDVEVGPVVHNKGHGLSSF